MFVNLNIVVFILSCNTMCLHAQENPYSCVGSDLVLGNGTVGKLLVLAIIVHKIIRFVFPGSDFHFSGTALGGWLVLEPWITPSLFYQFLGATSKHGSNTPNMVGMDSHTFCTSLGDEEANRQVSPYIRIKHHLMIIR